MTFSTAVQTCLSKFLMLSGRAARPEYWWFYLFTLIVTALASVVDGLIFGFAVEDEVGKHPFTMLASFITFFPLVAAGWRRMHDTGRKGWLVLLPIIVVLCGFAFFLVTISIFGAVGHVDGESSEQMQQVDRAISAFTFFVFLAAVFVAGLLKLWWLTRPGDEGDNEYGPPPLR